MSSSVSSRLYHDLYSMRCQPNPRWSWSARSRRASLQTFHAQRTMSTMRPSRGPSARTFAQRPPTNAARPLNSASSRCNSSSDPDPLELEPEAERAAVGYVRQPHRSAEAIAGVDGNSATTWLGRRNVANRPVCASSAAVPLRRREGPSSASGVSGEGGREVW